MKYSEKRRQYIAAVQKFYSAAVELSNAWQELDSDDEIGVKDYPFMLSLEELVHDIGTWTNTIKTEANVN